MNNTHPRGSILVGVDGSQAAIRAALWAIDEAASREVPLRLIHVTHNHIEPATFASVDNERLDLEYGETALRMASDAVTATGRPVKVETAIVRGDSSAALVAESRDADMVCVGSVGKGRFARALLGSTAAELAATAKCPVAIIRAHQTPPKPDCDWIAVPINDSPDHDVVVQHAMDEARVRQAPVLALGVWHHEHGETLADQLDRLTQKWRCGFPDVHVRPVETRSGVAGFLAENDKRVQLAVIGTSDVGEVVELIGPRGDPILGRAECSVLVAR